MKIQRMRAWYKPEKKMYHVLELDLEGKGEVTLLNYVVKNSNESIEVVKKQVPLTDCTIMNSTSRLTRSNTLIYEGDLVKYGANFSRHGKVLWDFKRLTWIIDDGKFGDPLGDITSDYIEVEGTIFSKEVANYGR